MCLFKDSKCLLAADNSQITFLENPDIKNYETKIDQTKTKAALKKNHRSLEKSAVY